jgi:hypothetical protein
MTEKDLSRETTEEVAETILHNWIVIAATMAIMPDDKSISGRVFHPERDVDAYGIAFKEKAIEILASAGKRCSTFDINRALAYLFYKKLVIAPGVPKLTRDGVVMLMGLGRGGSAMGYKQYGEIIEDVAREELGLQCIPLPAGSINEIRYTPPKPDRPPEQRPGRPPAKKAKIVAKDPPPPVTVQPDPPAKQIVVVDPEPSPVPVCAPSLVAPEAPPAIPADPAPKKKRVIEVSVPVVKTSGKIPPSPQPVSPPAETPAMVQDLCNALVGKVHQDYIAFIKKMGEMASTFVPEKEFALFWNDMHEFFIEGRGAEMCEQWNGEVDLIVSSVGYVAMKRLFGTAAQKNNFYSSIGVNPRSCFRAIDKVVEFGFEYGSIVPESTGNDLA